MTIKNICLSYFFPKRSIGHELTYVPNSRPVNPVEGLIKAISTDLFESFDDDAIIPKRQMNAVYSMVKIDREEGSNEPTDAEALYGLGHDPTDQRCCINRKRY